MTAKQTWQERRIELVRAAIVELLNRPTGESAEAAMHRISKAYNGIRLPGGKRLKLSFATLRRIWWTWKKNPSDEVLALHFKPAVDSAINPWISFLLAEFAVQHGLSIPQAYKRIANSVADLPFTSRTMRRHIAEADQRRIKKAVQLRKRKIVIDREIESLVKGENHEK